MAKRLSGARQSMALLSLVLLASCGRFGSALDWPERLHHAESVLVRQDSSTAERFYALNDAAKAAYEVGRFEDAAGYAGQLLETATRFPKDWNYGNAVHDGHMVLGRLALRADDVATAETHLHDAGATPGSPQLDSFGPNMSLARDLLAAGHHAAVLEYLDQCGSFWELGADRLRRWKADIENGELPDFGANLFF